MHYEFDVEAKHLLLDSANLDDIRRIANNPVISGVTTNPSLMAKEKKGVYLEKLVEIADILNLSSHRIKHLSVEVVTDNLYSEAIEINNALTEFKNVNTHIKIPFTFDNLAIVNKLEHNCVQTNVTACMTANQAIVACKAIPTVISFFYNRMKDGKLDADYEIRCFNNAIENYGDLAPDIICGSIRRPEDIYNCWVNGADYVTASLDIIEKFIAHEQTDKAIKKFQEDINAWHE